MELSTFQDATEMILHVADISSFLPQLLAEVF